MSAFNYKFKDLVDIPSLNEILNDLYNASQIPSAIIDLDGNFLTGAGWQRICLDFHRKNPESEKTCIQSDSYIRDELLAGESYVIFECPHGLVDSCCPVMVDGHHLANVFTGQMLHSPLTSETRDRFKKQAREFGFNEDEYLEALSEVPVLPIEKHKSILTFLANFTQQIAQMGLVNLRELEGAKASKEREEKLRALIETASTGYVVFDQNGLVLEANSEYTRIVGYQQLNEIIGRNVFEWIASYDFERSSEELDKCLKGERILNLEVDYVHPDGSIVPIEVSATSIKQKGQTACLAMVHDISYRKQVENSLMKSKAQLAESQVVAKLGSWDVNLVSGVLEWSLETFRLFDKDPRNFIPSFEKFVEMIHPDDREIMQLNFESALASDENPYNVAIRIINETGREWVMEMYGQVKRDVAGTPIRVSGTAQDITAQKKVEDELTRANEEWEQTFDAMSDIITIQDQDMRIIRGNKAANDFFEVKPGGLHGKHCYEIFRGTDEPCENCPELETIADCRAHSGNIKHEQLGKTFHVSSSPVFEADGKLKYLVHVAKDITDQKKLEEDLFQSHKMEAIGTLAGGIAHDFNNILSAIIGYSELTLMDLSEKSKSRDNVSQIYNAGHRAKDLVKQILSFSRKNQQKLEPFEPSSIIKEALKLMRASLPASIAIQDEIDSDCGKILADPTNLHQILVNLCTNALHAIENEKGKIKIKLASQVLTSADTDGQLTVKPGKFIVLSVSDTGSGIDEVTMKRIFEPYFTTKSPGKGTGMGLAVVHGIVKGYGGMIKVISKPNKETTFELFFPAIDDGVVSCLGGDPLVSRSLPRGNERIMVIDDEEAIAEVEQAFLKTLGYNVTCKNNSREALEEFLENPVNFDLILTDQTMPFMTGVDLAKEVMKIRPDMPIILCTGYSSVVTEEEALAIGIKRYARKPIDVKTLAVMIRQVLDNN